MSFFEPIAKTGRQRYRVERIGWLRPRQVLILQCEERGEVVCYGRYDVHRQAATAWRDATVGDLTEAKAST